MVETTVEKEEGIGLNHELQWGPPWAVWMRPCRQELAITPEELLLLHRPSNRPSHEDAARYFDKSV